MDQKKFVQGVTEALFDGMDARPILCIAVLCNQDGLCVDGIMDAAIGGNADLGALMTTIKNVIQTYLDDSLVLAKIERKPNDLLS